MTSSGPIHYQSWGEGSPVLALHGLGLESSSFTGLARGITDLGLQMLAADLSGFGETPDPGGPLSPAALAEPVLELAAELDARPLVMGMSLGARVALEAVLTQPDLFRGFVGLATPFPWRNHRHLLLGARLLSPLIAERIPVEWAWPVLKWQADRAEAGLTGDLAHDWFLRASKRTIHYISCPATRRAFVSAARELALDPAFGPDGLWTRVEQLQVPAAFVWGDKDRIIGTSHSRYVQDAVPQALQVHVPCAGHFDNGPHFLCMEDGAIEAVRRVELMVAGTIAEPEPGHRLDIDCRDVRPRELSTGRSRLPCRS